MRKSTLYSILALTIILLAQCNKKMHPTSAAESKEKLVWSEEFNYSGLPDSSKWNYDIGNHGWGNNELEYYTNKRLENARVENGNLVIEARREKWENNN